MYIFSNDCFDELTFHPTKFNNSTQKALITNQVPFPYSLFPLFNNLMYFLTKLINTYRYLQSILQMWPAKINHRHCIIADGRRTQARLPLR